MRIDELRELPDGSLLGADGLVYRRTPRRVQRRMGRDLVEGGAPVAINIYPEGLVWHDGPDAATAWAEIPPRLITGARPNPHDLQCVGHVWESETGELMLRFDGPFGVCAMTDFRRDERPVRTAND